ncbi:MAG TPA: hypothetical protein VK255_00730 [Patescibacteria group bacterium]|nr:hypothetical protein [Patescibacteria group bacterium]
MKKLFPKFLVKGVKNEYWRDKANLWLIILSLLVNIINWVVLLVLLRPATENIILHYNVYFGVDQVGKRFQAFVLPVIGFIIFLVNLFLSRYFFRNNEMVASYILLLSVFMAQLSLIIASISVIIINY